MNSLNSTNIDPDYVYEASGIPKKQRIDVLLASYPEVESRAMAQRLLKEAWATVNGKAVTPSYKVRAGDRVGFSLPAPEVLDAEPEPGELDVLFEDEFLIVINKPAGQVVHPAPGHSSGTLVNFLLHHCQDLSGIGGIIRPGIVHRIDKDTSGILVMAKSDKAHIGLSDQFREHSIHRQYQAVVWGNPTQNQGTISGPIARHPQHRKKMTILPHGKPATTHWKVVLRFRHFSLVQCRLETGRTHQIRVHMTSQNMPLYGDPLYGSVRLNRLRSPSPDLLKTLNQFNRQALHAQELGFVHPITSEHLHFSTPLPDDMQNLLTSIEKWDQ